MVDVSTGAENTGELTGAISINVSAASDSAVRRIVMVMIDLTGFP
jgi:hypothetical protein